MPLSNSYNSFDSGTVQQGLLPPRTCHISVGINVPTIFVFATPNSKCCTILLTDYDRITALLGIGVCACERECGRVCFIVCGCACVCECVPGYVVLFFFYCSIFLCNMPSNFIRNFMLSHLDVDYTKKLRRLRLFLAKVKYVGANLSYRKYTTESCITDFYAD